MKRRFFIIYTKKRRLAHEKLPNIFEKPLDTHGRVLYDNWAPEKAQSAMMREIAPKGGNFRGVCPTIGRLSEFVRGVYRRVR